MKFKQVNQFIATKDSPLACHYNPDTEKVKCISNFSISQNLNFCVLLPYVVKKQINRQKATQTNTLTSTTNLNKKNNAPQSHELKCNFPFKSMYTGRGGHEVSLEPRRHFRKEEV